MECALCSNHASLNCKNRLCRSCCRSPLDDLDPNEVDPDFQRYVCSFHGVTICAHTCDDLALNDCSNKACEAHCTARPCSAHQTCCEGCSNWKASDCTNNRCGNCCSDTKSYKALECPKHLTQASPLPRSRSLPIVRASTSTESPSHHLLDGKPHAFRSISKKKLRNLKQSLATGKNGGSDVPSQVRLYRYQSEQVAVKIFDRKHLTPEQYSQILQEADIWDKCTKEIQNRIAAFIGVCITDDRMYLVSRYYKGGALTQYLDPPLPFRTALRIMTLIAEAITSLHEVNILHRDIAARNILLSHDPTHEDKMIQSYLCDFGLAKIAKQHVIGHNEKKHAKELPPDIKSGKCQKHDKSTDVYMFGMLLITMVAYKEEGETLYELPRSGLIGILSRYHNPEFGDLRPIISDCLMEVSTDRPTIEEVHRQLSALLYR